jgi:hypothetical protein
MADAGYPPDPWQQKLLRSDSTRFLLLCGRQMGKSTVSACLAILTALLEAPALVLLLSPSERQSGELFRDKVKRLYRALGRPVRVVAETALTMELANGSRIIALPGTEGTVRCYSGVNLLIIDEASRVEDALYCSVRPMLAVSKGRLLALSTPFGKRGWFHDEWHRSGTWERVRASADQCPRISRAFLDEERQALGERWYRQEYACSFEDTMDAVFSHEHVMRACVDAPPLFGG